MNTIENNTEKTKKQNHQEYERIGVLTIEEVLPYIKYSIEHPEDKSKANINGFVVNTKSIRLKTFFHTGVGCACCGLEAQYFAVERTKGSPENTGFHLNLWGKNMNNEDVLFTHDHIVARSLGGKDDLKNTTTMCGPCNWEKGVLEHQMLCFPENKKEIIEEIKKLKIKNSIYNQIPNAIKKNKI